MSDTKWVRIAANRSLRPPHRNYIDIRIKNESVDLIGSFFKKMPNPYRIIDDNVRKNPLKGWVFTHYVGSSQGGVYFVPQDWTGNGVALNFNATSVRDQRLRGHRLLFEFFKLETSLEVKISARVLINDGNRFSLVGKNTLFEKLQSLALALGCPQPRGVGGTRTRTCAVWPELRPVFSRSDSKGMADWIRQFLVDPPQDFKKFVEGALPLLRGKHPPL
jgi:hypothetical protein